MAISKIFRELMPITTKSWTNQSVEANTWYVGASINIPAGSKVLILAGTNNGKGSKIANGCNLNHSSGTANTVLIGNGICDAGSSNSTIGWAYIDANTDCVIQVRQYGYTEAISASANGVVLAITLQGKKAT